MVDFAISDIMFARYSLYMDLNNLHKRYHETSAMPISHRRTVLIHYIISMILMRKNAIKKLTKRLKINRQIPYFV